MKHIKAQLKLRHHLLLLTLCLLAFVTLITFHLQTQTATAAASEAAYFQTPIISMGSTSYSTNEGSPVTVRIQINVQPPAGTPASVHYTTFPVTAVAGQDYVAVTGIVTFTNSSPVFQDITIQTITNNTSLVDRYFNFVLYDPVNATLNSAQFTSSIRIINTNVTATPTPTGGPPIFADALEPNNSFNEASNVDAGGAARCNLTFYPPGDQDFFRWWGQAGISYRVFTRDLDAGLDTQLQVFDTNQNLIAENDDETPGGRSSSVTFTANVTGFYFARVINTIPGDPVDKTYCFEVSRFLQPTLTPPPAFPSGADSCEYNSTTATACLIVVNETLSLNFIPTLGSTQDTDMFRLWVKPGIYYTCETNIPAGSAADTNMILLDGNGNPFNPWIGNDDKEPGDLGSLVSYLSTYTGWLFVEVGPVNVPPLAEASQHTYTLTCTQLVATPTPTATNTPPPVPTSPGGGGGTFFTPTPMPTIEFPTPFPTPTPINPADFIPTPVPPPLVDVQPLPTATAVAGSGQLITVDVTIFYDSNNNYLPELTEGIVGVDVALFDNATRDLLSYGQTNDAGMIRFEVQAAGTVRIVVPFLNYSQVITQSTDQVLIRVAPGTLPIGIP
ncbi:MAG: pre-peptidase C-terminal domain-containing protein [Anaerolineae bacterium]|nr:pre-peptidase C-terminal domain-containing protein [Anaerolineae bacterium]